MFEEHTNVSSHIRDFQYADHTVFRTICQTYLGKSGIEVNGLFQLRGH